MERDGFMVRMHVSILITITFIIYYGGGLPLTAAVDKHHNNKKRCRKI